MDETPTEDSAKPITSGGVKAALDEMDEDISSLNEEIANLPDNVTPEETGADLYICDENGNVIGKFVDGHIVTKNFDSSKIKVDFLMEANASDADLYICDGFGNVVAKLKNGHIVTKNFNSANYSNVLSDISTLQTDLDDLESATSGILFRNKDILDGVYAACRWHQPNSSSKQFCMLIAGDTHTDPTRMENIIKMFNSVDAFDCGVMLGDIAGDTFADTTEYYDSALTGITVQKPWLTVLGNHDVRNAGSDSALFTKYGGTLQYADLGSGESVSGKMYYYKDFTAQKIRIIVLMQYDYTYTTELSFGQAQIDWLIGVLNSTPSDYGVIICEHTNPSRYMTYEMDAAYTSSTWKRTNYAPTYMNGDPVPDIVNAWINGTTLSQTYAYTYDNPPTALSVSADFSSRGAGEFITYLGGHWHMDVLGHPTSYADQPDYHVPAAGLPAATQGDIPRKAGTISEDSFCVMGVDRDSKTVKIFHVGAHRTKDAVDRQYFKYTYGGSAS